MNESNWNLLLIDDAAIAAPLDEQRFRSWMAGRRVFVSSVMDVEMTPYREAVRAWLDGFGPNVAVMWETISPDDKSPTAAYLNGVDTANFLVGVFGKRYGVADETGYSPTHKEVDRAKKRHIQRLLFTVKGTAAERDGKLNDWLRSIYNEISANEVSSPTDLVKRLDARFREYAARSERAWIKLGRCIFPGVVQMSGGGTGRTFKVTARTQSSVVRRQLLSLCDIGQNRGVTRLTWPDETYPVVVTKVEQSSEFVNEADIQIHCQTPQNWYGGSGGGMAEITYNNIRPDDMTEQWTRIAFFGEEMDSARMQDLAFGFALRLEGPSLPEVLTAVSASGWQAEGIVRLYLVEELGRVRGLHFTRLSVGPAGVAGVPIDGKYSRHQSRAGENQITGVVLGK